MQKIKKSKIGLINCPTLCPECPIEPYMFFLLDEKCPKCGCFVTQWKLPKNWGEISK